MTTRRAAMLMLAGWYLMLPPVGHDGSEAVLSGWGILHSYDTAPECEASREKREEESGLRLPPLPSGFQPRRDLAICVASDDPRLKVPFEIHVP
jgi:hypothetical protein